MIIEKRLWAMDYDFYKKTILVLNVWTQEWTKKDDNSDDDVPYKKSLMHDIYCVHWRLNWKPFHILSWGLVCALVSCFTLEMSICMQRLCVWMCCVNFSSMGKFVIFHFWNISHHNVRPRIPLTHTQAWNLFLLSSLYSLT